MNRQEALDKAYLGLMDQGCRSTNNKGSCLYRGPNGLKCIIGMLVDDEIAAIWDATDDSEIGSILIPSEYEWIADDLGFYSLLQSIHDSLSWCDGEDDFREYLTIKVKGFSEEYNLTVPTWGGKNEHN